MGGGVAKLRDSESPVCGSCSAKFSPFKQKKSCHLCGRTYCFSCTQKVAGKPNLRTCNRCSRLFSGNLSRKDLEVYTTSELHNYLMKKKVAQLETCRERNDLVDLILKFTNNAHYQAEQREHERRLESLQRFRDNLMSPDMAAVPGSSNPEGDAEVPLPPQYTTLYSTTDTTHSSSQSHDQSADPSTTSVPSQPDPTPAPPSGSGTHSGQNPSTQATEEATAKTEQKTSFKRLSQVESIEAVKDLTTRQLKEILSGNFVDYKGCVEKAELVQRVERLYVENESNKKVASEIDDGAVGSASESELCKICMDRVIDCVLLECGHMLTCTQCGKQLAECPICRQYVVRVVHIFKS